MQGTGYAGDRKAKKSNETVRPPRNQQRQAGATTSKLDAENTGKVSRWAGEMLLLPEMPPEADRVMP